MTTRMVDRCPSCSADRLELHEDWDGDETGTWAVFSFVCAACGRCTLAEACAGEHVPVVDDEDEQ